ncbi:hypothetical protein CAter282_1569 [Collimonas arenae]|uniref:Uncharacterized protein n=1 Tax=Collimonas arenae TaxID=279058 RepID=A0A127QHR9_9BURK|nr:hypothetical protein [Collimonas arenae]AMO99454.1 hypothetical protein CAter10_1697 [Collimonas arenae]AMP09355.1 hypothetical protein CAter282_1569 [Collimonas arenae]
MSRSNLTWVITALILGAGGAYAVWLMDGSGIDARAAVVNGEHGVHDSKPVATSLRQAVNINPFGK